MNGLATALGIFGLTFVLEDAAVFAGAFLAGMDRLPWPLAFAACFLGVWAGDVGLYALARTFGRPIADKFLARRRRAAEALTRSEQLFARHGWLALVVCRFVPGSRLPTYLSAGLLRMPFGIFLIGTGVFAAVWVTLVFQLVSRFGDLAPGVFHQIERYGGWVVFGAAALAAVILMWRFLPRFWKSLRHKGRWKHWEFWPPALFYLPVALHYLKLAAVHRSLTLPSCANPGFFTGGLIGESKYDALRQLQRTSPEWTAASFLIPPGDQAARIAAFESGFEEAGFFYPVVLKPDVAQRGSGFRVIRNREVAIAYISSVSAPVVCQAYVAGPREAGLFYVRRPHDATGRIVALTEKIFPEVVGDGRSTLSELIAADPRASIVASVYLARVDGREVLPTGERLRLVEAGNHAQGCIFRDGAKLWSPQLEKRIDAISQGVEGFYIGRYDVRYSLDAELRAGRGFKILELNGAASEATNAYDASKSLGDAYAILFRQWDMVFEVAAQNRKAGCRPAGVILLLRQMLSYSEMSSRYPLAD